MKKAYVLALVLALAFVLPLRADEAARLKIAEELLGVMNVQENISQALDAIKKMQASQFKSFGIPESEVGNVQEVQNKIMDIIEKELSWDKLKGDYIKIYANTFTEEELQGLIDFYKSPIGQKFIKKTPELTEKTMEITQKQMADIMPKIMELAKECEPKQGEAPAAPKQAQ